MKKITSIILITVFIINISPLAAGEMPKENIKTCPSPINETISYDTEAYDYQQEFEIDAIDIGVIGFLFNGIPGAIQGVSANLLDKITNDKHLISFGIIGSFIFDQFESAPSLGDIIEYLRGKSISSIDYDFIPETTGDLLAEEIADTIAKAPSNLIMNFIPNPIGFLIGIGFGSGMISSEYAEHISSTIHYAIAASQYLQAFCIESGKKIGVIVGIISYITDESLMALNLSNNHHISEFIKKSSQIHLVFNYILKLINLNPFATIPYVNAISLILGTAGSTAILIYNLYYSNEESQSTSPMQLHENSRGALARIMNEEDVNKMTRDGIAFYIMRAAFRTKLISILDILFKETETGLDQLDSKTAKILKFALPLALGTTYILFYPFAYNKMKNTMFILTNNLSYTAEDAIDKKYEQGETPLKLSLNPNNQRLVGKKEEHLNKIINSIHEEFKEGLEAEISSKHGLFFLIDNELTNVMLTLELWHEIIKDANEYIAKKENSYKKRLDEISVEIENIRNDINRQSKSITYGDKLKLLKQKKQLLKDEARDLKKEKQYWTAKKGSVERFNRYFSFIVNYSLIAAKIFSGEIDKKFTYAILSAIRSVISKISWYSDHATQIEEINKSIEDLHEFIDKIEKEEIDPDHTVEYICEIGEKLNIILENVSIGVNNKTLTHTDYSEIPEGICAAIGKSGCGKSAFISKVIKGIMYDAFWIDGKITFQTPTGECPEVLFIDQDNFLTSSATLLENLFQQSFHDKSEDEIEELIQIILPKLMKLEFQDEETIREWLTTKKDWGATLSGGQQKMVAGISAIVRADQADIIALDEPFSGLDPKRTKILQDMFFEVFKKNKIVIAVDHDVACQKCISQIKNKLPDIHVLDEIYDEDLFDMPLEEMHNKFLKYFELITDPKLLNSFYSYTLHFEDKTIKKK